MFPADGVGWAAVEGEIALRGALPELTALVAAVESGSGAIPLDRLTCDCAYCLQTKTWFYAVFAALAALDAALP
jgi:hypothetical protein